MADFSDNFDKFQRMQKKFLDLQTKINNKIAELENQKLKASKQDKEILAQKINTLKSKKADFIRLKREKLSEQMDTFLPKIFRDLFILSLIVFFIPVGFFVVRSYRKIWYKKFKIILIVWLAVWIVLLFNGLANSAEDSKTKDNPSENTNKTESKPKIENKTVEEKESIPFATIREDDNSINKGEEKVAQKGEDGEKVIKYEVKYEDDKEVSRKKKSEEVTREPVNEIIKVGTYVASQPSTGDTSNSPQRPVTVSPTPVYQQHFANCDELRNVYPHGVGRAGAADKVKTGGAPVTNYTVNDALYNSLNGNFDRDNDGIACEA